MNRELLGGRGLLLWLAAEWTVLLDWSADGLGRVLRGVALDRDLLGRRGLGLVEAAEAVAVELEGAAEVRDAYLSS